MRGPETCVGSVGSSSTSPVSQRRSPAQRLNRYADPNVLLLAFAVLMSLAAIGMLRRTTAPTSPPVRGETPASGAILTPAATAEFVAAALLVGFLTGFLDVGGGFIIVPALVTVLGFTMPVAVGTSLLVITLNSVAALAARAGSAAFDWSVIIPFTVAAVLGSLVGTRPSNRTSHTTRSRAFAGLLTLVGTYVALRSAVRRAR